MNFIISITSPEALPVLTGVCEDMALPLNVTLSGRGTAVKSMLDVLGIESNLKRIMFSVANEEKTREFITRQKRQLHIGVPGHGIVIAVPVKSIGGGKTVAYLRGEDGTAKYTPSLNYAYELIVVIANEGRTDTVMNAARAAGARGGTVLHGKGTGSEAAMKFLNISIADEKEVILIVAPTAEKTAIMSEILKKPVPTPTQRRSPSPFPPRAVAGFGFSGDAE